MIKDTLSTNQVIDALRADTNAGWSYYGAKALAEYLEDLSEDMGEDIELDVVAIRCDYSEYDSAEEYAREFNEFTVEPDEDEDEDSEELAERTEAEALTFLEERTQVIPITDAYDNLKGYIIASF